eukprot:5899325-Amphidinium_carterae.1
MICSMHCARRLVSAALGFRFVYSGSLDVGLRFALSAWPFFGFIGMKNTLGLFVVDASGRFNAFALCIVVWDAGFFNESYLRMTTMALIDYSDAVLQILIKTLRAHYVVECQFIGVIRLVTWHVIMLHDPPCADTAIPLDHVCELSPGQNLT